MVNTDSVLDYTPSWFVNPFSHHPMQNSHFCWIKLFLPLIPVQYIDRIWEYAMFILSSFLLVKKKLKNELDQKCWRTVILILFYLREKFIFLLLENAFEVLVHF